MLMCLSGVGYPPMLHSIGPMRYTFRTRDCRTVDDVRALWRLSYRSFFNGAEGYDYVKRYPGNFFRRLRAEQLDDPFDYATRLAEISEPMGRSTVVKVAIDRLNSRHDILKAFRLVEKYGGYGRHTVDRAVRMARKHEQDGGVLDDYAAYIDWAIGEVVNHTYGRG